MLKNTLVLGNHHSPRRPRRIVTVSGGRGRGRFPSRKSEKPAQFESGVEEMALRFLEAAPSVISIATQPVVIEYSDGARRRRYTPDIEVTTVDGKFFLEVKDDRTFSSKSKAASRLKAAIQHFRQQGSCLYVVLWSDLVANDLQRQLALLFRERPRSVRYRPSIDATLWDPENSTTPPEKLQREWENVKRQCDELFQRIMKRDPDDLLPVSP